MHKIGVVTSIHPRDDSRINKKISTSLSKIYETNLIVFDGLGDDFSGKVKIHDSFDVKLDKKISRKIKKITNKLNEKKRKFIKKINKFKKNLNKKIQIIKYKFIIKLKKIKNILNKNKIKFKDSLVSLNIGMMREIFPFKCLKFLKFILNLKFLKFILNFAFVIFLIFLKRVAKLISLVFYYLFSLFYLFLRALFHITFISITLIYDLFSLPVKSFSFFILSFLRVLSKFPFPLIYRSFRINKTLKSLNLDIFHLHDPELVYLGIYLKLNGKKVIYDSHESFPKQIIGKTYFKNKLLNFFSRYLISFSVLINEFIILRFFDGLIAATPTIQKQLIKINPMCEVINNYVVADEITPPKGNSLRNKIVYIGSVSVIKGVKDNVISMQYLPKEMEIDIVGRVSNDMQPYYFKYNSKRINFHGKLPRSDLQSFFNNAFVGLCIFHPVPNYIEAQPIKLYEYMAAGIPVIVSDFPLWKKFVKDNKCGFSVSTADPKKAAYIINKLYKNKKLTQELGRNAREAIMSKYNWGLEEVKLLAFYKNILNEKG